MKHIFPIVTLSCAALIAASMWWENQSADSTKTPSGAQPAGLVSPTQTERVAEPPAEPELATEPVTLAFGGDVHFERRLRELTAADNQGLLPLRDSLGAADFAMVNLETAITTGGSPIPGKKYTFRTSARALTKLADVGVDAVSLANNHGADFGAVGLADTLAAKAQSPIPMVGIGKNAAEAYAPATVEIKGIKTAVFGSSQLYEQTSSLFSAGPDKAGIATNMDTTKLVAAIEKARETHDLTVVMLHWGTEGQVCPDSRQLRTVKDFVAAKADIVVGAHSHRQQGSGWYDNTFVSYGLGNFIWYRSDEPSAQTGVLTVQVDPVKVRERKAGNAVGSVVVDQQWQPMLIGRDGAPTVRDEKTTARLHNVRAKALQCSKLAQTPPE